MKRILIILMVWVAATAALPVTSHAKPAYCFKALFGCYDECADFYSDNKLRTLCAGGCYLGYLFC